jgi:hypothetical protein
MHGQVSRPDEQNRIMSIASDNPFTSEVNKYHFWSHYNRVTYAF